MRVDNVFQFFKQNLLFVKLKKVRKEKNNFFLKKNDAKFKKKYIS